MNSGTKQIGKVFLVGAGPGDPKLLTLRGRECLRAADLVVYDYLANAQLLEHVSPQAECVCPGRHGQGKLWSQEEINAKLIAGAQAGKNVVRLKGGDPTVFGRLAEELGAIVAAGIPFEIVPGVTTALAAGSYAGIPVTHRALSSAVALVTGHETNDKGEPAINYTALANFPGTLVIYMGVTTAARWSGDLLAAGKPSETPVAIVRNCSRPDQRIIRCTLGEVAERLSPAKVRPPAIVIVGAVANLPETYCWFDKRPLFGQTVLVTRPRQQTSGLRDSLSELGAEVLLQPAIEITPPRVWQPVDDAIGRLGEFDWLVFSSSNGVQFFFERLFALKRDLRAIGHLKLAAIGPGTADELAKFHLQVDVLPEEFRAESLAESLASDAAGQRFLLLRASRGREVLAEQLTAAGAKVTQIVVYESLDVATPDEEIAARLAAGRIDWVTVTSSAIARSLAAMFGDALRKTKLASISPITSGVLRELGFEPAAEAQEYTMAGVVAAILSTSKNKAATAGRA